MLNVSGLYIYPIKSLGGISVDSAMVTARGLQHDRSWMLVDDDNHFITQREFPEMALLQPTIADETMQVVHKLNGNKITISLTPQTGETVMVEVWGDRCRGQLVDPLADEYFSDILNKKCRLVFMPDTTNRRVDGRYAFDKEITSFSDGFPMLIISEESLADLNMQLEEPVPMDHFRPNIVFKGGYPFQEDVMKHFSINGINLFGVKRCARCPITTINQSTAIKAKEPLKTLAKYRTQNNKVYFGQNLLHKGAGVINVGDVITVINEK
jgi:uncharacterized protein YcbX